MLFHRGVYFPLLITPSFSHCCHFSGREVAPSVVAPSYESLRKGCSRGATSHLVDLFPPLMDVWSCGLLKKVQGLQSSPLPLCAVKAKLNCIDSSVRGKTLATPDVEGVWSKGNRADLNWRDRGELRGISLLLLLLQKRHGAGDLLLLIGATLQHHLPLPVCQPLHQQKQKSRALPQPRAMAWPLPSSGPELSAVACFARATGQPKYSWLSN